jgi:glycosyltransferase involved in cell wall biosynthesis
MKRYLYLGLLCAASVFGSMLYTKRHEGVSSDSLAMAERPLLIVVPSYKNAEWYERNLKSIFEQQYSNYHVVYIDDRSPDGTGDLVEAYIKEWGMEDKVTLIRNEKNLGALQNIYNAIYAQPDNKDLVVCTIDGDDWLATPLAFQRINEAYKDPNVWMTYGQYRHYPDGRVGICRDQPKWVVEQNAYRRAEWVSSHMRTFYAWLFKRIKVEDMTYNGELFRVTWDQAFMLPMLEMVNGRFKFIPEILYVYNCATPLNDYKVRLKEQLAANQLIRSFAPYEPLSDADRGFVVS